MQIPVRLAVGDRVGPTDHRNGEHGKNEQSKLLHRLLLLLLGNARMLIQKP
jgi:hypothetical protein